MAPATFTYRGFQFAFAAQQLGEELYTVQVQFEDGPGEFEPCSLPQDADPYGTEAEAVRHAQQQAMRWVHDRTGDGQGQF